MTPNAPLDLALDGPIARLTLNRPDMRNAFDETLIAALTAAVKTAVEDSRVRVLLLTGAGKAFCAGGDLNWMRKMGTLTDADNRQDATRLADMLHAVWTCPKPIVACVNGDAYAGGMGLVAACDMAVAADSAHFCLSETRLGLLPANIELPEGMKLYVLHAEDGSVLGFTDAWASAYGAALQNELVPVAVH